MQWSKDQLIPKKDGDDNNHWKKAWENHIRSLYSNYQETESKKLDYKQRFNLFLGMKRKYPGVFEKKINIMRAVQTQNIDLLNIALKTYSYEINHMFELENKIGLKPHWWGGNSLVKCTPLHYAVVKGMKQAVELLLNYGANIEAEFICQVWTTSVGGPIVFSYDMDQLTYDIMELNPRNDIKSLIYLAKAEKYLSRNDDKRARRSFIKSERADSQTYQTYLSKAKDTGKGFGEFIYDKLKLKFIEEIDAEIAMKKDNVFHRCTIS